jgi:hypothetical protein
MESSTARWSIPGKSISFNEGAEQEAGKVLWGFHKAAQQNKKGKLTKKTKYRNYVWGSPFLEHIRHR